MNNVFKEAIVLLFLNVLFVQSRTVLKTHIVNDSDSLLTQKTEGSDLNSFEKHINEIKTSSQDINAYSYNYAGAYSSQRARCRCENGKCEKEGEIEICKCLPGFGNFSSSVCKACDCGEGAECIFTVEYSTTSKVCLCPPGYSMQDKKCVDCECGPDSSCTFTKLIYNKFKKECHCNEGYREENEKCVENCKTDDQCSNGHKCLLTSDQSGKVCAECDCRDPFVCVLNEKAISECKCKEEYTEVIRNNEQICVENCETDYQCSDGHKCLLTSDQSGKVCAECDCNDPFVCVLNEKAISECKCKEEYTEVIRNNEQICVVNCRTYDDCFEGNQCLPTSDKSRKVCAECGCANPFECVLNDEAISECKCPEEYIEVNRNNENVCLKNCITNDDCSNDHKCLLTSDKSGKVCAECPCKDPFECFLDEKGMTGCGCPVDHTEIKRNNKQTCQRTCADNDECPNNLKCLETSEGYAKVCVECDCKENYECILNGNGESECSCGRGHLEFYGQCLRRCSKNDECHNDQKCVETTEGIGKVCAQCQCQDPFVCFLNDKGMSECRCPAGTIEKTRNYERRCLTTCTLHEDCTENQICLEDYDSAFCVCAQGLSGDLCDKNDWCDGQFKNCKGINGTCEYSKEDRVVVCTCSESGKKVHPIENRCSETCFDDDDCKNGGTCNGHFCYCKSGFFGDKCETVFDCTVNGKYSGCVSSGGYCSHDGNKVLCECPKNQEYHERENICKETCYKLEDCKDNEICVTKDGWNTCVCADGLSGENCEKNDWCDDGKFKNCKGENGICEYNKEKRSVDCTCPPGKELHSNENICQECDCGSHGTCRFENGKKKCDCDEGFSFKNEKCLATCSYDQDCEDNQKCREKEGRKTCVCADGLSGEKCETNYWCGDTGKFKSCKGINGTCEYNKRKRSVNCICASGKKLDPSENRCKDTCDTNEECNNFGICHKNFCWCRTGILGDKCETIFDCTIHGKYRGCEISGGQCKYNGSNTECICLVNKYYHDTHHFCTECSCGVHGSCTFANGKKNCHCSVGFKDENGTCLECNCGPNGFCRFENGLQKCECDFGFAIKDGICTATCHTHEDCKDNEKCVIKDGWKTCVCADGLSGENCDKKYWCEDSGVYKSCKGDKGTCEYNKENRSVQCVCPPGKELHPTENICKKTCTYNYECENLGICNENFCWCRSGIFGDKCETIFECTIEGIYKSCEISGGKCTYEANNAVCICPENKSYHDTGHFCSECNCGPRGICYFEYGRKGCDCDLGYVNKDGICTECNCGPYGTCSFSYGQKKCECHSFATEINGVCVVMETTSTEILTVTTSTGIPLTTQECNCGPYGSCSFSYGQKKCECQSFATEINGVCVVMETTSSEILTVTTSTGIPSTTQECNCGPFGTCSFIDEQKKCECHSFAIEINGVCVVMETTSREFTTVATSTIMPSTPPDCDCGENSESCHFNWKSGKVCKCSSGYAQRYGMCYECNCGINSYSCYYRRNGTKVCNCDFGFDQVNGYCTALCNEDKCVHGKCEVVKNDFKCRCNEGFTGQRCEERIQTKLVKEDLWKILQVSVVIAIFIMLCGFLCSMSQRLNKISNK